MEPKPTALELATALSTLITAHLTETYITCMGVMKVLPNGDITVALRPPTTEEVERFTY